MTCQGILIFRDTTTACSELPLPRNLRAWLVYPSPDPPSILRRFKLKIHAGEKTVICGLPGSGNTSPILGVLQMINLHEVSPTLPRAL